MRIPGKFMTGTGRTKQDEPDEMTTHAMDDELQALLDGEVDGLVEAGLRAHLNTCGECTRVFERLRSAAGCFALAIEAVDAGEPVRWGEAGFAVEAGRIAESAGSRGISATMVSASRTPPGGMASLGLPSPIRWAAGLTLFLAGAASAALVLGVPILPGREAGAPASQSDVLATSTPGAAVAVQPLEGAVEVILADVAPGSELQMNFGEGGDVLVDVAGVGLSRFEVRDGTVSADLAGVPARVTVVFPRGIEEVLVRVGNQVVARAGRGEMSPAEAAGPGGWIPLGPP